MQTDILEKEIISVIHDLPLDKLQSILDFSLFVRSIAIKEQQMTESEDKLTVLRSALIAGENSGVVENYSLDNLLAELDSEELT